MKLVFLGGGNMAAAIIGGLLQKGQPAASIGVLETDPMRRQWLTEQYGVATREQGAEWVNAADVLLLAVKPQQLRAALAGLPRPPAGLLVLSICAGVRGGDIAHWLGGHGAVVRAMPNTPALVGAGVTGLYALPSVDPAQQELASEVMQAVGSVVWVEDESLIDAVTAISGSGPAYVFYFIEALEAAAANLGLAPDVARHLALQTFFGAAVLAVKDKAPPPELRARVTSRGGTTEQGIRVLEEGHVKETIVAAAWAAAQRARQLGDMLGGGE